MKISKFILTALFVASTIFGITAFYKMVFKNEVPFFVETVGIKLDKNKVYALSNIERKYGDTISIGFEQTKHIMPKTLAYIQYSEPLEQFVLTNASTIGSKDMSRENSLLPFCVSKDGKTFFESGEVILQKVLQKGIRYNIHFGNFETRVPLNLFAKGDDMYLSIKDKGIKCKYPIFRTEKTNEFSFVSNRNSNSLRKCVFSFDAMIPPAHHDVDIQVINSFQYTLTINDMQKSSIVLDEGRFFGNKTVEIGDVLIKITSKYSFVYVVSYMFLLLLLVGCQVYFLYLMFFKSKSPINTSLLGVRVLFNALFFLGIPLFFATSYFLKNREIFPFLMVLLNASYFIHLGTKKYRFSVLRWYVWIKQNGGIVTFSLIGLIGAIMSAMILFAKNEAVFGIPVLHVQKMVILLAIFLLQWLIPNKLRLFGMLNGRVIRISIIVIMSVVLISATHDFGSLIYTLLAFSIIELIRSRVKLKQIVIALILVVSTAAIVFNATPESFTSRKGFRLIAPYWNPENIQANQADRETYSTVNLLIKNTIQSKNNIDKNKMMIPGNMRSTSHSDYAFVWSFVLGKWWFLGLFCSIAAMILYYWIFLIYCLLNPVKVNNRFTYVLSQSRMSELAIFLVAITLVQVVYPMLSNLMLVPLTGQSVPCLSVSNYEIVFLTLLFILLELIFSENHYQEREVRGSIDYATLLKRIQGVTLSLFILFVICLFIRLAFVSQKESFNWKKNKKVPELIIPENSNKDMYFDLAYEMSGNVGRGKNFLMKDLASRYYSNMPYQQIFHESSRYVNSSSILKRRMQIDSLYNAEIKRISGHFQPFGVVYSQRQYINGKIEERITNKLYTNFGDNADLNDLQAELNNQLHEHVRINKKPTIGSIVIIDNKTQKIMVNSSYPYDNEMCSSEKYYPVGSVKKVILAHVAPKMYSDFSLRSYEGKTLHDMIVHSNNDYAAHLLQDILANQRETFGDMLKKDFGLLLNSSIVDAYMEGFDEKVMSRVDPKSFLYRTAIGGEKYYKFIDVVYWFVTIANDIHQKSSSYSSGARSAYLQSVYSRVLTEGTARNVGLAFQQNDIDVELFGAKTGTLEVKGRNVSSTFVIFNEQYTIGVMLNGDQLPENSEGRSARHLFEKLIPTFQKYAIF
jgi:hypothetical protein